MKLQVIKAFPAATIAPVPQIVPASHNAVFQLPRTSVSKEVPKAAPRTLESHATVKHQPSIL